MLNKMEVGTIIFGVLPRQMINFIYLYCTSLIFCNLMVGEAKDPNQEGCSCLSQEIAGVLKTNKPKQTKRNKPQTRQADKQSPAPTQPPQKCEAAPRVVSLCGDRVGEGWSGQARPAGHLRGWWL